MTTSLYLDHRTLLHQLDGRTKILGLLGMFILALLWSDPWSLGGLLALVLGGMVAARAMSHLRSMWVLLTLLFVYSAVLWPLFVEGRTPALTIGNWVVTVEGLTYGVGMGLRLNVLVMSGILFLSTTPIEEVSRALRRFGLPPAVGFTVSLAFRWVPTLLKATTTIVQAQRSRGLDLTAGNIFNKIRRYPPLVVPLIGHTLRQTTLLAMALESKGFGPGHEGHPVEYSRLTRRDYLALFCLGSMLSLGILLKILGVIG